MPNAPYEWMVRCEGGKWHGFGEALQAQNFPWREKAGFIVVIGEKAGKVWWLENVVGVAVAAGKGRGGFVQIGVGVLLVELCCVGSGKDVGEGTRG